MQTKPSPIPLWPEGAPGALGDTPGDRPCLTPFLPGAIRPTAAVVVCPGGGYYKRAPHEGGVVAEWLASIGIAGLVLDYRVAPYRHPIPMGDAQRAIRLVRAMADTWGIDPERVGILGFSAGGHCAASAATTFDCGDPDAEDPVDRQGSRPDALIAGYPVITFTEPHGHQGSMENLLGEPVESVDENLRLEISLETRVTAKTPPTFIWHTASDPGVPVEHSLMFAAALSRCGVPFALHVFPSGGHGLGLAEDHPTVRRWTDICHAWLREIGFATNQGEGA